MHLFINVNLTSFPLALINNLIKRRLHKDNDLARVHLQISLFLSCIILVKEHVMIHYDVFVDCLEDAEGPRLRLLFEHVQYL